ncbi:uncharacterized protein CIMG_12591 [Coccidioides immitis RS]|uniref:Uncharacterized protein n=1 Tax=Coccidioides immitis (strain RS) TaxID=246410 RepID=A0A0D8JS23_COCIM|nr:uncharacterized protein CIMG_12591 [Coccidioides immitis RS]KJF59929.1 hypothetical protein CIMG_12591 [Coccidioides immitis RS]
MLSFLQQEQQLQLQIITATAVWLDIILRVVKGGREEIFISYSEIQEHADNLDTTEISTGE